MEETLRRRVPSPTRTKAAQPGQRFSVPMMIARGGGDGCQDNGLACRAAAEASDRRSIFPDARCEPVQNFAIILSTRMLPHFRPHQEMPGKTVAPAGRKIAGASAQRPNQLFMVRNGNLAKLLDERDRSLRVSARVGGKNLASNTMSETEKPIATNVSAGFCPSTPHKTVAKGRKLASNSR